MHRLCFNNFLAIKPAKVMFFLNNAKILGSING